MAYSLICERGNRKKSRVKKAGDAKMAVTYNYIMKMSAQEMIERKDEVLEYLKYKEQTKKRLQKQLQEVEMMIQDVKRKMKMVGLA